MLNSEMKKLYGQLHEIFKGEDGLSNFFPICGNQYGEDKNIRLMVVGRAVNGWGEFKAHSREEFIKTAETCYRQKEFDWLGYTGDSGIRDEEIATDEYKDAKGSMKHYNIRRSQFWMAIKEVLIGLYEWQENEVPPRWYEAIVWSNLYAISPFNGGNPSWDMMEKQRDVCAKLLLEQINLYSPTHILFFTDADWFEYFFEDYSQFKNFKEDNSGQYPAYYNALDGIKMVVMPHPMTKKRADIVSSTLKHFK